MMIDVDKNLDLKEGEALYSTPLDLLNAEQLAKAYAYALQTWGDSVQSRIVLDAIRGIDEALESALTETNETEQSLTNDHIATLNAQIDDLANAKSALENEVANLKSELELHGSKL